MEQDTGAPEAYHDFAVGKLYTDRENPIYQLNNCCPEYRSDYQRCVDNFYALNINVRLTSPGRYQRSCKEEFGTFKACLVQHMERWAAARQGKTTGLGVRPLDVPLPDTERLHQHFRDEFTKERLPLLKEEEFGEVFGDGHVPKGPDGKPLPKPVEKK